MPRQARLDFPGLLHHVIARGIERRPIFNSPTDYADFLSRIEINYSRYPCQIYAWALMPNHFHLLVRSGENGIFPFMKRLMTGYAVGFNHRHKRAGHLFQNRYKSIVCEEGPYFLELIRYIHLNPYRAKMVNNLEELSTFPYTGHPVLLGKKSCSWQNQDGVLSLFSRSSSEAVRGYFQFMKDGENQGSRPDLMGGGLIRSQGGVRAVLSNNQPGNREAYDSRILGSGEFVEGVLRRAEKEMELEYELKRKGVGIQDIAKKIAKEEGVDEADLYRRVRTEAVSRAKARLIHVGVEYLGRTNREMALLTRMSDPSASEARRKGAGYFRENEVAGWLLPN
ncbi:MAG: transposase [Elusimicrobia bacterium]|nr:transposase [Elusimicrobiota bacterium]MBP9698546.1 transposase [Elusimicrobiota bacterium]